MNTSIAHILKAPLNHVKRQFIQDCVFVFNGATFLSTPALLSEIRSATSDSVEIYLDLHGLPVSVDRENRIKLQGLVETTLTQATERFIRNQAKAKAQFDRLMEVAVPNDEPTE